MHGTNRKRSLLSMKVKNQLLNKLSDTWDKRRSRYIQGYTKINERNTTTWRETDPDPSEILKNTNYHLKIRTHIPSPEKQY